MDATVELKEDTLDLFAYQVEFENFLRYYIDDNGKRIYWDEFIKNFTTYPKFEITIDISDLYRYNQLLGFWLLERPLDVLPKMQETLFDIMTMDPRVKESEDPKITKFIKNKGNRWKITVRISDKYNFLPALNPREISSDLNRKLIKIRGVVNSVSAAYMKRVYNRYRCSVGQHTPNVFEFSANDWEEINDYMRKCPICRADLVHDPYDQVEKDARMATIQDEPELLKFGEDPQKISVLLTGRIVYEERITAGATVEIIGILIPSEKKKSILKLAVPYLYGTYVHQVNRDLTSYQPTEPELEQIKAFIARSDNILHDIAKSIATNLYDTPRVLQAKIAVALALFSGGERGDIRKTMNVLIVGDPGTGKTSLQQWLYEKAILPGIIMASGKNASAAGLIGGVDRDPFTNEWRLMAGAAVFANDSILLINELDKLPKNVEQSLLEAMEEQVVSVQKMGIHRMLYTRTTFICTANPALRRFTNTEPLPKQINIDEALLSRFDYIILIPNTPGEWDALVAAKILQNFMKKPNPNLQNKNALPVDLLRKYIIYARQIEPEITQEAGQFLTQKYYEIRKEAKGSAIPIDPRHLESIIRTAIALARMELSDVVTLRHMETAYQVWEELWKPILFDPELQSMDIDKLTMVNSSRRDKIESIKNCMAEHDNEEGLTLPDILEYLKSEYNLDINMRELRELINLLYAQNMVYKLKPDRYRIVK